MLGHFSKSTFFPAKLNFLVTHMSTMKKNWLISELTDNIPWHLRIFNFNWLLSDWRNVLHFTRCSRASGNPVLSADLRTTLVVKISTLTRTWFSAATLFPGGMHTHLWTVFGRLHCIIMRPVCATMLASIHMWSLISNVTDEVGNFFSQLFKLDDCTRQWGHS